MRNWMLYSIFYLTNIDNFLLKKRKVKCYEEKLINLIVHLTESMHISLRNLHQKLQPFILNRENNCFLQIYGRTFRIID